MCFLRVSRLLRSSPACEPAALGLNTESLRCFSKAAGDALTVGKKYYVGRHSPLALSCEGSSLTRLLLPLFVRCESTQFSFLLPLSILLSVVYHFSSSVLFVRYPRKIRDISLVLRQLEYALFTTCQSYRAPLLRTACAAKSSLCLLRIINVILDTVDKSSQEHTLRQYLYCSQCVLYSGGNVLESDDDFTPTIIRCCT